MYYEYTNSYIRTDSLFVDKKSTEMRKKHEKRYRRHRRIRAKIMGTAKIPRLCVFRSSKHIYAQLIDDERGRTLVSATDKETKSVKRTMKSEKEKFTGKVLIAYKVGKLIAEKALVKKIQNVVFDRGGYQYHGRVEALAKGAREGGLRF